MLQDHRDFGRVDICVTVPEPEYIPAVTVRGLGRDTFCRERAKVEHAWNTSIQHGGRGTGEVLQDRFQSYIPVDVVLEDESTGPVVLDHAGQSIDMGTPSTDNTRRQAVCMYLWQRLGRNIVATDPIDEVYVESRNGRGQAKSISMIPSLGKIDCQYSFKLRERGSACEGTIGRAHLHQVFRSRWCPSSAVAQLRRRCHGTVQSASLMMCRCLSRQRKRRTRLL